MTLADLSEPRVGDRVLTLTGRFVGRVLEVTRSSFRVGVDGNSYWLSREAVFTSVKGEVTLVCEARGLRAFLQP